MIVLDQDIDDILAEEFDCSLGAIPDEIEDNYAETDYSSGQNDR